mgnify:CR=1 FL=1
MPVAAVRAGGVHALAHITGGGFIDNIPRVLPKKCDVLIRKGSWEVLPIFQLLQAKGARASVPLLLEVQRRPERRILESGNELFAVSGRIVNPTSDDLSVPDIRAELRDAQGKMVYGWTITPPRRTIEAKSVMEFNSAEVNVPRGAKELNLSF